MATPWRPARIYADPEPIGRGWDYSDSSRYIRMGIRALFRKGEQLWDSDYTNNKTQWTTWLTQWAIHRRNVDDGQTPPYYSPSLWRVVYDPKHSNPQPGDEDMIYFYVNGMPAPIWYGPRVNQHCWVKADRMLVSYTVTGWQPIARLADKQWQVEVHVFMQGAKKGVAVAEKRVSEPFKLTRDRQGTRAYGLTMGFPITILKNGDVVGVVSQNMYFAALSLYEDEVVFAEGDVITFQSDVGRMGLAVGISLVGSFI